MKKILILSGILFIFPALALAGYGAGVSMSTNNAADVQANLDTESAARVNGDAANTAAINAVSTTAAANISVSSATEAIARKAADYATGLTTATEAAARIAGDVAIGVTTNTLVGVDAAIALSTGMPGVQGNVVISSGNAWSYATYVKISSGIAPGAMGRHGYDYVGSDYTQYVSTCATAWKKEAGY